MKMGVADAEYSCWRSFLAPVTKIEYGLIRVPSSPTTFSALDGVVFDVLAEHRCGNAFKTSKDGAFWFWDYETDELVLSKVEFRSLFPIASTPSPVELLPEQVRSVRTDPAFQKSVGRMCRKMAESRSRPNGNNKTTVTLFLGRGF
jgi:hypothetical protein